MSRRVASATLVAALSGVLPAMAQDFSPQQFRDACTSSAGNVVQLSNSANILSSASPLTTPVSVTTGCTVVLQPGATLTFESVAMIFMGGLSIQASIQTEIKMIRTRLQASSIAISLSGTGSVISTSESNLHAASGNLSIAFGDEGKLEIVDRLLVASSPIGFTASGALSITSGRKFSGGLNTTSITAPLGIALSMGGEESTLSMSRASMLATAGSVTVASTGQKALIEVNESLWRTRDGMSVTALGTESTIAMNRVQLTGVTAGTPTGAVTVQAGGPSASQGKVTASLLAIANAASITFRSSVGSQGGHVSVETGDIGASGDLRIESGSQGSTTVKDVDLGSGTLVRVATGNGGSCLAEPRLIFGNPVIVQLCP